MRVRISNTPLCSPLVASVAYIFLNSSFILPLYVSPLGLLYFPVPFHTLLSHQVLLQSAVMIRFSTTYIIIMILTIHLHAAHSLSAFTRIYLQTVAFTHTSAKLSPLIFIAAFHCKPNSTSSSAYSGLEIDLHLPPSTPHHIHSSLQYSTLALSSFVTASMYCTH